MKYNAHNLPYSLESTTKTWHCACIILNSKADIKPRKEKHDAKPASSYDMIYSDIGVGF